MYKLYHGNIPTVLRKQFQLNNAIHSHNTRASNSYHVSGLSSSNFMFYCIRIWNTIYDKININVSFPCFKKISKHYLTNNDINLDRY